MNVKITTKTKTIERDITRYSVTDDAVQVALSGGRLDSTPKNGDIANVVITDEVNGNVEVTAQFVSYNFIVYENPQTGEANVIGDNSLLFKILDI